MAKAKGTKEAPVEEFSVDVEQSDTVAAPVGGGTGTGTTTTVTGTENQYNGAYGNGNADWNDPDD